MNINKSGINRVMGVGGGIQGTCVAFAKACILPSCSDLVYEGQTQRNQPSSILISSSVFLNLFPWLSASLALKYVLGMFQLPLALYVKERKASITK